MTNHRKDSRALINAVFWVEECIHCKFYRYTRFNDGGFMVKCLATDHYIHNGEASDLYDQVHDKYGRITISIYPTKSEN